MSRFIVLLIDTNSKVTDNPFYMKTGAEYRNSKTERSIDCAISYAARPAEYLARIAAAYSYGITLDEVIYRDTRVGANYQPMIVEKIVTLDGDEPINEFARLLRKIGGDELPQMQRVRDGTMSVWGRRPLLKTELEEALDTVRETENGHELLASYDKHVVPAKPGIISTFGFAAHRNDTLTVFDRIKMDIQDHVLASLPYNLRLLLAGVAALSRNELRHDRATTVPRQSNS